MNVLSLFDGISSGQIALDRVGIKYTTYYASEIYDKAIETTQKNYPNTIQLGDVKEIDESVLSELPQIDLLIFGFPCRNLSRTVINNIEHNQGLEGQHSSLFYDAVRILKSIKPKYFLVENVASMKNEDKDIITETLGVEPRFINSSVFSAQDRKRYYWTNIPIEELPEDKGLVLRDIIQDAEDVEEKYWYKQDFTHHSNDKRPVATLHINGHDILKRVYGEHQKAPTLTACRGGNHQKKVFQDGKCRKLTPLEYERLQQVPDGYTAEGLCSKTGKIVSIADSHRYNTMGDGWSIDVIAHIFKGLQKD